MKTIILVAKALTSLILFLFLFSSCETVKYLSLTDGSKSDGTLTFSYDVGSFEKPIVQWETAITKAKKTCVGWGYTGADWLGDGTKNCIQYNQYGCINFRYTYLAQCTGELPVKEVIYKKITIELTQKEKAIKELKEAKELLDLGILTQEEFNKKSDELKSIILGK